jgi:hypothetical protein
MGNVVRRLLLVALLAGLAAGCSGDDESAVTTTTSPTTTTRASETPTGAERTWVESVGEWSQTFGGELSPNAIADCPESLREQAGPRPTARLAGLEDLALALCRAYRRLAQAGEGGRAEALATANRLENAVNTQVYGFEFIAGPSRPLPVKGGITEVSRIEPRLSRVLSQLTKIEKSEARCWSDADWKVVATHSAYGPRELGGFVDSAGAVQLNPVVCRALVRYLYGHAEPTDPGISEAVVIFTHEAQHARGEDREDRAECYGMQRARQTARFLGMTTVEGEALVKRYWRTVYPTETPPYFSDECRDGGELDVRPETHVFP